MKCATCEKVKYKFRYAGPSCDACYKRRQPGHSRVRGRPRSVLTTAVIQHLRDNGYDDAAIAARLKVKL